MHQPPTRPHPLFKTIILPYHFPKRIPIIKLVHPHKTKINSTPKHYSITKINTITPNLPAKLPNYSKCPKSLRSSASTKKNNLSNSHSRWVWRVWFWYRPIWVVGKRVKVERRGRKDRHKGGYLKGNEGSSVHSWRCQFELRGLMY